MSQQAYTQAVDPKAVNTPYDTTGKTLAELVTGIRIDTVPANEGERLAAAGEFYPLTVDKNGFLRVTLPDGTKVESTESEVLREIRDVLFEVRDLLMKIA